MNLTIPPFVPAMAQRSNLSIPNMSKPALKMPQLQRQGSELDPKNYVTMAKEILKNVPTVELTPEQKEALVKQEEARIASAIESIKTMTNPQALQLLSKKVGKVGEEAQKRLLQLKPTFTPYNIK